MKTALIRDIFCMIVYFLNTREKTEIFDRDVFYQNAVNVVVDQLFREQRGPFEVQSELSAYQTVLRV